MSTQTQSPPAGPPRGELSGAQGAEQEGQGAGPAMFGRGLLYVVVLSLQIASATLVSPVLAHLLGPSDFGSLASAIALYQVLVALTVVGLDQALVLLRAQQGDDAGARALITCGSIAAVVVTAAAAATASVWAPALGFEDRSTLVLVIVGWTAPTAALQVVSALLLSQDRLRAFTAVNLLSGVGSQVTGVVLLLSLGSASVEVYAAGGLAALLVALVIGLVLARPRWPRRSDHPTLVAAFRLGAPLMVSGLAVWVLNAGDRLVILHQLGEAEAGRYQVAYTVANVVLLLIGMTRSAWAPHIASIRDERPRTVVLGQARDRLVQLVLPVVLGVVLGAPVVLRVATPDSFEPSGLLVIVFVIVITAFPVIANGVLGLALVTLGRVRTAASCSIAAAVANIGLNLALVPVWGLTGAAAATLLAFSLEGVLQRMGLPRGTAWPPVPRRLLAAAALVTAAAGASVLLPQDTEWSTAKFVLAVACLPWFLRELRRARSAEALGREPSATTAAPTRSAA